MEFGRSYEHYIEYLRFIVTKFTEKDTTISYISDVIQRVNRFDDIRVEESMEIANILG